MNERSEVPVSDARLSNRLLNRLSTDSSRTCAGGVKPAFTNTGHEFEPTGREPQPLVNRAESLFEFCRSDHMRGEECGKSCNADVSVFHD